MAVPRWLLISVGVIALKTVVATSAGSDAPVTELSFTRTTISDLPQITLYAVNQTQLSDNIKSETPTNSKDARPFHVEDKIQVNNNNNNNNNKNVDNLDVTALPPSTFLPKTVTSGGDVNVTGDGKTRHEKAVVGMPVAAALTATTKGYTRYDGTYMVNDEEGTACVMVYFKSQATIYYPDSKGDFRSKVIAPAEESQVSGSCDRPNEVSEVCIAWSTFIFTLRFGKDDDTDSYFVSRFSLTYNLSDSMFPDSAPGSSEVTVSSKEDRKFWQTSNAYSFRCLLLHDVALSDAFNNTATLHFDEVRSQAFCLTDVFRRPKHCIHRVHRDEMVPVTVGATLAGSTLLTVAIYGIFRYFKVKKVQYDTME